MTIRDIVREYLIAHGHDGLTTDDDWDSCGCGVEAEIERLKETNTRLNRRATKAEAIADKSIEQLRNEGQRNLGRMLANYAAEKYHRECAEKDAEIERLRGLICEWLAEFPEFIYDADGACSGSLPDQATWSDLITRSATALEAPDA